MAGIEFLMRHIECQAMRPDAFACYGQLIDASSVLPESVNDGSSERYSDLATLDVRAGTADPKLSIYIARARNLPLRIARLERHRQASQVFIPLGMQRFIVVVAAGELQPDWHGIMAFVTEPGQGICIAKGCWHHGLIALGNGDRFAVIDGGGYRLDTKEVAAPEDIWLTVTSATRATGADSHS